MHTQNKITLSEIQPDRSISRQNYSPQKEDWQHALSRAVTDPKELYGRLQLDYGRHSNGIQQASEQFSVFVTESYLKKIQPGNPDDPLLLQVLPKAAELEEHPAYDNDPLAEQGATVLPGLLHKYQGRVLLVTNSHCAINCRFCFRRNFPYAENHLSPRQEEALHQYLSRHREIHEVILSGGEPLLLTQRKLDALLDLLESVPHLQTLRIHTRIPLVLPERINRGLLEAIRRSRLRVVMVIHCNHPAEIDQHSARTLAQLHSHCHSLLNQSVLLHGVNDNLDTLIALQEKLFEHRVGSYYLHLPDKVRGTVHFDLATADALELYRQLQARLPGYMLPKLVRENPGDSHKTLMQP